MAFCCVLLLLLNVFQTSGTMKFTSSYGGNSEYGTVRASKTFTWSFSGGVGTVEWGLKSAVGDVIVTSLVFVDKTGMLPVNPPVPAEYSGRVNGTFIGNSSSGTVKFTLSRIRKDDARVYGCKITSSGVIPEENFDSVRLIVAELPSITHPTAVNASYTEGNPVNISCAATGTPDPDVRWMHNGQVKSLGSKTAHLTFSKIRRADAVMYTCQANNSAGRKEKQLNLIVNYKPEGTTISLSAAQNTAVQGDNVTLTCQVSAANPPVSEYRFYVNDSNTPLKTLKSTNSFTIYVVQRVHYGRYKCEAWNVVGEGQSNVVVLNINVPASIKSLTGNVTVNETNTIELMCDVDGYPVPAITWKKDGKQLKQHTGKNLRIDGSTKSDSGKYTCVAKNILRRTEMKTFVTVYYRATITSVTPPSTKSWIGQSVQVKCVADGVPTPDLTWIKPDGNDLKKVTATENLVNVAMKEDKDFGLYTCQAENIVGGAFKRTVEVKQIKAPSSPSITSTAADIQATSLTVKWTAPADDGGSPVTAYRVVITQGSTEKSNENITDPNTKEFNIGNLDKDTHYAVKVYARNYVFEGNASLKIIKTNYEGVPAAATIIGLPPSTKKVEVTIKWNQPPDNGDAIFKYTVYQRTTKDNGSLGDWNKLYEINDPSKREAILQLVKGKEYEFVVTATNKFGESLKEEGKIKKIKVLGEAPAAVDFTAKEEDGKITLKWKEPENNGGVITKYSVYQRFVNDEEWKKLEDITDTSKRKYVLEGEEGKEYEFVVTATNKYGESSTTDKIQKVKVLKGTDGQKQGSGGMNMAVIAGAAAAGVLLILALIIFGVWWKRRKTSSEHGSSVADLSGHNPDDFDDGYHAVGAAAAAHQLQASGRAAEATYAQVDMSQKKNRQPVTDLYAQVDKSKKTKKKRQKQPGELDYAELDDLRPNFQPPPQPPGAAARPLVRAPAYEGTEYADITQFGVPQPEPTYDNVPKKDVVYSNVESM